MNNQDYIMKKIEEELKNMSEDVTLPDSLKSENLLQLIDDIEPETPKNNIIFLCKKFALPIAAMVVLMVMFPFMRANSLKSEKPEMAENGMLFSANEAIFEECTDEITADFDFNDAAENLSQENSFSYTEENNYFSVENEEQLKILIDKGKRKNSPPPFKSAARNNTKEEYKAEKSTGIFSENGFEIIHNKKSENKINKENSEKSDFEFVRNKHIKYSLFDGYKIAVSKNGKIKSIEELPYLLEFIAFTYTDDYIAVMYEANTEIGKAFSIEFFDENLKPVFSFAQNGNNAEFEKIDNNRFIITSKYAIPTDDNGNIIEEKLLPHIYDMKKENTPILYENIKINENLSELVYTLKTDIICDDGKFTAETTAILN